jgi:ELWxxDGT repeat protein
MRRSSSCLAGLALSLLGCGSPVEPTAAAPVAAPAFLVADLRPGPAESNPYSFRPLRGSVVFIADDGSTGRQVWITDGTTAGTGRLTNLSLTSSYRSIALASAASGERLHFTVSTFDSVELWVTDATAAGTRRIATFGLPEQGYVSSLTPVADRVFFTECDPQHGYELWTSDGTSSGTRMVRDVLPGPGASVAVGGSYPQAACQRGYEDAPKLLTAAGGRVVFQAEDGRHGRELWASDGTSEGTWLLADAAPGTASAALTSLASEGSRVVFATWDGAFFSTLWTSDGTPEGTRATGSVASPVARLTAIGSKFLFVGGRNFYVSEGDGVWVTDGTTGGTEQVSDILVWSSSREQVASRGRIFFRGLDLVHGKEVWTSDGTRAGTYLVADVVPGPPHFEPSLFAGTGTGVAFARSDEEDGSEHLWWSDGTPGGTILLDEGSGRSDFDSGVACVGGVLVFSRGDSVHGRELWASRLGRC